MLKSIRPLFKVCFLILPVCVLAQTQDTVRKRFADGITKEKLRIVLTRIASDEMEGRESGKRGQKIAADYISLQFKSLGLQPAVNDTGYFQSFPLDKDKQNTAWSENVLGYIEGSDLKTELIVISAHYDHLGIRAGHIFNGADDDGSGTAAVIELAAAFSMAQKQGYGPRRSLLFLLFSGEEKGLLGSEFYVEHPVYPLTSTVADLNIDMIGRIDDRHKESPDSAGYVYVIGSDKMSLELHRINEEANSGYCKLSLDYTYNSKDDPHHYYYRSDQYNFVKQGIPVIFYFNGTHADYHRETDRTDKINFELLCKRTRLVFLTAWELAARNDRIKTDGKNEN